MNYRIDFVNKLSENKRKSKIAIMNAIYNQKLIELCIKIKKNKKKFNILFLKMFTKILKTLVLSSLMKMQMNIV